MTPNTLPRIRARVGKIEESNYAPWLGKLTWNIQVYTVDKKARPTVQIELNGHELQGEFIFDTEEEAKASSTAEVTKIASMIQQAAGGRGDEGGFSLTTGEYLKTRPHQ